MKYSINTVLNSDYMTFGKIFINSLYDKVDMDKVNFVFILDIGLKKEDPRRGQFILSTYKRLLTSHLSTTGANIKGFTALVSLNSAADLATSAINFGQSKFYKYINGDVDKAEVYINRAYGSLAGVGRRFADAISPDLPMSYADKVLELNPDFNTRLFRDVSGDGGVRESMEVFNLDKTVAPERMLWKTADSVTKGAQTLTLVRLQDDLTKRWAFGTNTNQAIMREYGVSPEVFYSRPDVALEMASDRFKEMVLEKALFRTQRETASVNWSTLPGREGLYAARTWAKGIEIATNRSALGFVVPFGSFLNTTVATMADLTGVNAFRFGINAAEKATLRNGFLKVRGSATSYDSSSGSYHEFSSNESSTTGFVVQSRNSSYTGRLSQFVLPPSDSTSNAKFIACYSSNPGGSADLEFYARVDGQIYADGSFNGGGADYAEFFEWKDGNTSDENRVGCSVVLDGNQIRKATSSDNTSNIIGVISVNPSVVGDADGEFWKGTYLKDDFGKYIFKDSEQVEWTDKEGVKYSYQKDHVPSDVTVPSDAKKTPIKVRTLNPDYDKSKTYERREDRKEWSYVGMMGKLRMLKGQPTGDRWIKMRDISDTVEEWLVR